MSVKDDGLMALRYAGALGLLAECAVQVDDETRDSIMAAMQDAAEHHGLRWRRVLHRIEIDGFGS